MRFTLLATNGYNTQTRELPETTSLKKAKRMLHDLVSNDYLGLTYELWRENELILTLDA